MTTALAALVRRAAACGLAALAAATSACDAEPEAQAVARPPRDSLAPTVAMVEASVAWTVDARNIGRMPLGVPLGVAGAALGETLHVKYDTYDYPCDYVYPAGLPAGTGLMVVNDTVMRVDVDTTTLATERGIRVGDPIARVHERYPGRVRVEPHMYDDGHYLVVSPEAAADSAFRIVFETDRERVTRFRAGRLPAVEWVEGCS